MAVQLTCHFCNKKITLFSVDAKKRKGHIRCPHCGNVIAYDLSKRRPQRSGFWSPASSAFDSKKRKKLEEWLNKKRNASSPKKTASHHKETIQAAPGFASFDLVTGRIIKK